MRTQSRVPARPRRFGCGALVAAVLLVAGCGGTDRLGGPSAPAPGADDVPPLQTFGSEASSVRALDESTLEITLRAWTDDFGCPHNARAEVTAEENDLVYVTTLYDVDTTRHCDDAMATATAVPSRPLGGRGLVIDQREWRPAGGGGYRLCDDVVGCDPQPAGCDDDSNRLALDAGDFPRNGRTWTARACAVPWLVLDVDTTASGCAATGDDPESNPCLDGPRRVTRWVFRQAGPLWDQTALLPAGGGCGQDPPKGLPAQMCRSLPPVGSG